MLRQHLLVLASQLLVHSPDLSPSSVCARAKPAARRNAMSDFSRDVKPDNNRWRFAAKPVHLLAANSNSSSPSCIRVNDGGDSEEQE